MSRRHTDGLEWRYPGYWKVHVGMPIQAGDLLVAGPGAWEPRPVPAGLLGQAVGSKTIILRVERRRTKR
jgi:hypothetical protein